MDDRRLATTIGRVLQTGVLLAAGTVFAGGVLYLVRHHSELVYYRAFAPGSPDLRTLHGIARSAAQGRSEALIQIGLLLLIATPISRVATAIAGFALEGDRLYTVISLIVLTILAFSLFHAS